MSKLRSLWQYIHHRLFISLIGAGVLVILAALVYGIIRFGWGWTGFTGGTSQVTVKGTTEDTVYLASKTLWDWMQLLLVPAMLAVGGFWLNQLQKEREERATTQRDKVEREIATDNQQEAALQSYIDKIGELLLREHEHLGASPGNPQVETIARARTVTVLRILDPARRVSLLRFLSQAGILQICTGGDLRSIDLQGTNLIQFDLSKLNLDRANLSRANLSGANLAEAHLIGANLSGANLSGANLAGAYLIRSNLNGTNPIRANLSGANLSYTNFCGVKGLTDKQRADYQSRGASVDPVPSTVLPRSTALAPSSTLPSNKGQSQSSPTAGATTHLVQKEEDSTDATSSSAPPTQPDSPS